MSRSLSKPGFISRKYKVSFYTLCSVISRVKAYRALSFRGLAAANNAITMRNVAKYLTALRVKGRIRIKERAILPRRYDCIYRITKFGIIYQNMNYGLRSKRNTTDRVKLLKYYSVNKQQLFMKFGSFLRTRSYSGFRIHKDRKKLEKMRKDIEKAARQAKHRRRENSRLMRKAIMETRAARRRKLGAKVVKKKK